MKRETKTVDTGPWTEEYLPPRSVLHTVILYKKPSLSKGFIQSTLGRQEGDIDENAYLNTLEKLYPPNKNTVYDEIKKSNDVGEKLIKLAQVVKKAFRDALNELKGYVILGGHETIGKGIVRIEFADSIA